MSIIKKVTEQVKTMGVNAQKETISIFLENRINSYPQSEDYQLILIRLEEAAVYWINQEGHVSGMQPILDVIGWSNKTVKAVIRSMMPDAEKEMDKLPGKLKEIKNKYMYEGFRGYVRFHVEECIFEFLDIESGEIKKIPFLEFIR